MNFPADATSPTQSSDGTDAVMGHAVATIRPGWMVLKHCVLGISAETPACVHYALVHPKIGIALLDIIPDRRTPEPVERLRRALDAVEFKAIFGGWPPIIYRRLTLGQLSELGIVLAAAFALEAPLALGGGDAWVGAALRALTFLPADTERAPTLVTEPRRPNDPGKTLIEPGARGPRRESTFFRARAVLYGCLMVSALSGTLLLSSTSGWPPRMGAAALSAQNSDPVVIPMVPAPSLRTDQPNSGAVTPPPMSDDAPAIAPMPAVTPAPPRASQEVAPPAPEAPTPYRAAATSRPMLRSSRAPSVVRPSEGNGLNEHCQTIILKVQLGEEPSDVDRTYLRHGCPRG